MHMSTMKSYAGIIKPTILYSVPYGYRMRILSCGKLCGTIRIPLINYQSQRNLIRMTQKTEARLKVADNIPKEYELIYRAPSVSYIKTAQSVSTFSIVSLIGIGLYKTSAYGNFTFPSTAHFDVEVLGDFSADPFTFLFLVSSFMLFNLGIYSITLRYPYRIYHNPAAKSYICILAGLLPFRIRQVNFKNGDIVRKHSLVSSILPWKDAIFRLPTRSIFILENYFKTPSDFNTMLRKL